MLVLCLLCTRNLFQSQGSIEKYLQDDEWIQRFKSNVGIEFCSSLSTTPLRERLMTVLPNVNNDGSIETGEAL